MYRIFWTFSRPVCRVVVRIFLEANGILMSGTYSQLLLHAVFSTKHREPWLTDEIVRRLYPYMAGVIQAERGILYDIGGIEDHVHLYFRWRTDDSIANLLRTVKANSSGWIHKNWPALRTFAWQEGYGVFSVSKSQEQAVKSYIARQHEHHQQTDFQSEFLKMLRAHDVEFDERYVFD